MSNVAHAAPPVQANFQAAYYAKKILDRSEAISDQMAALEASIDLHLLMAAGLPTDSVELLAALKAAGDGQEEVEIADRQLINFILPGCGKTADAKMAHVKYARQKHQKALDKGAYALIQIRPGGGHIVDGRQEAYPTKYSLPIVRLRRDLIRALPDDPPPGAIEAAAIAVIENAYGKAIPRKHAGRRPLKDMSARVHMRMSVARLEKVISKDNAAQVITEALEQAPRVKLALVRALEKSPTEKPDILSAFERFNAAFQEFHQAAGQLSTDSTITDAADGIGQLLELIHDRLTESPNSQVVDSIEPERGLNFIPPPSETPEPIAVEVPLAPLPEGSHPLLRVESNTPPAPVDLPVGGESLFEKLTPREQAVQALQAFEAAEYPYFFFRLEDVNRDTLKSKYLTPLEAVTALSDWLSESDRRQASLMIRPKYHDRPEVPGDDAEVRVRHIHIDDIDRTKFEKVRPYAVFGFTSSEGNFQAAVCVVADKPTFTQLKERMVKFFDSDDGASGSFRWPGSGNWKPGRGGVRVQLHHVAYGRKWTPQELEESGLLAAPEPPQPPRTAPAHYNGTRVPPSYERAKEKVLGRGGSLSEVDLSWTDTAFKRGLSYAEAYDELWRLRDAEDGKPSRNRGYIKRTVDKVYA